jgi:hypothetical protein
MKLYKHVDMRGQNLGRVVGKVLIHFSEKEEDRHPPCNIVEKIKWAILWLMEWLKW